MAFAASKRFFKNLGYFLGLVVAAGLCCIALLMLTGQFEEGRTQPPAEGVSFLQPGQTGDLSALQGAFGAPLPCLPGYAMQGVLTNETYNGRNVRKAVLQYDGFLITCVQPAFASPLLLHKDLSLSLETHFTVAGLPAALAEGGNAHCLYFSTDTAAYSLYAPEAGRESFLALAEKIVLSEVP